MIFDNVKFKYIASSKRLNSDYHLSEGVAYDRLIKEQKYKVLKDLALDIFTGGRSKRLYVDKSYGIPYLGNTDLLSLSPLDNCKYTSKKFWKDEKGLLNEGMILTGRVGQNTVGSYCFATKEVEGAIGSDNVIRIINNGEVANGYLYAYLASKYGFHLSRRHISGNAQPFVTEDMLAEIPVPILAEGKQQEIHDLILESAELRYKGTLLLNKAKSLIVDNLPIINFDSKIFGSINLKDLKDNYHHRLDSPGYINFGVRKIESYKAKGVKFNPLGEYNIRVFRPGIFKRTYVKSGTGFPYIKGSELNLNNPFNQCDYLSKSRTPFLNELKLSSEQVLFTCAGTVGDVKLITKEFEEYESIGSQDIIRIESKDALVTPQYLFAYLSLDFVKDYIQSLKYGSVIERVEPLHIDMVPVINPTSDLSFMVTDKIKQYSTNLYLAFKKEQQAIKLVEQEIESWQKS